ncbi:MAG TPA: hypothetical protein VG015_05410 [Candidatus Dormibacteraeota bacterium]|jgi:hypothetical protein|nr:hypothetical protein [Candidatus Dormibacteraeota bacterium]
MPDDQEVADQPWRLGDLMVLAGGVLTLFAGFLPWWQGVGSAYADQLWPVACAPSVFALIVLLQQLTVRYQWVEMPTHIWGYSWKQIDLFLTGYAAVDSLSFLLMGSHITRELGLYMSALTSVVLLIGVALQNRRALAGRPI